MFTFVVGLLLLFCCFLGYKGVDKDDDDDDEDIDGEDNGDDDAKKGIDSFSN